MAKYKSRMICVAGCTLFLGGSARRCSCGAAGPAVPEGDRAKCGLGLSGQRGRTGSLLGIVVSSFPPFLSRPL